MLCRYINTLIVTTFIGLITCSASYARQWVVTSEADDPIPKLLTLREATELADNNDEIVFDPSLKGRTILLSTKRRTLQIEKSLKVSGGNLDITINGNRNGGGAFPIFGTSSFNQRAHVRLENLKITGSGNRAIVNEYGRLDLVDCQIDDNRTGQDAAGILNNRGIVNLTRTTVSNNHAQDGGGGLLNVGPQGELTMIDSAVKYNSAAHSGGLWNILGGRIAGTRTQITDNQVNGTASAIRNDEDGELVLTDCTISNNAAQTSPGAIVSSQGRLVRLSGCRLSGNHSGQNRGPGQALISSRDRQFEMTTCTLDGHLAGPAVAVTGLDEQKRVLIQGCDFNRNDGAIHNMESNTLVRLCRIMDNRAVATVLWASGITHYGRQLEIVDTTIANNSGIGYGAIAAWTRNSRYPTHLVIHNSTISGNSVERGPGGGIYAVNDATGANVGTFVSIDNSTISGNQALEKGGGLFFDGGKSDSNLLLSACTVTANRALQSKKDSVGGGIFATPLATSHVQVHNTIIAANRVSSDTQPPDVVASVDSLGFNLVGIGDGSDGWKGTDQVGDFSEPIDSRLGPLANNGGPTDTHALLSKSPAMDNGDPKLAGTPDQRGVPRDSAPDVGACECKTR